MSTPKCEMFKKRARNFRARKAESSSSGSESSAEEESGPPESPGRVERQVVSNRFRASRGRGLSCSSRSRGDKSPAVSRLQLIDDSPSEPDFGASGGASPSLTGGDLEHAEPRCSLLSFGAQTEGDGEQFKVKKTTVSEVLFKIQKKSTPASPRRQDERNKVSPVEEDSNGNSKDVCDLKDEGHSSGSEDSESSSSSSRSSSQFSSSQSGSSSSSSSLEKRHIAADPIPDARCIQAARQERQLARVQGDYIALDSSRGSPKGRCDADSDDEPDDHEQRITFAPQSKTLRQRIAEKLESNPNELSEDSEDENDMQDKWEEQQIRKAVRLPQGNEGGFSPRRNQTEKTRFKPSIPGPPINLEDMKRQLSARLASFEEVHRSHQREYEKMSSDVESSKSTINKLETASNAALQYTFYKTMKIYAENLADCLNEKIIQINELEAALHLLLCEKANTLLKRRQEDLQSEAAALQQLGKPVIIDVHRDGEKLQHCLEECMSRRNARKEARKMSGKIDHHDGMSSDDELLPDKIVDFQQEKDKIVKESKKVFEDVQKDFSRIRNILAKFQQWRKQFPDSYYDAYISLCLPKLLNPLIRIQLIPWNPLEGFLDLEQMPWFRSIKDFDIAKRVAESNDEDHVDDDILPKIIEKAIIPKISHFVEHVWDPLSSSQTNNLTELCKTFLVDYDSNKAKPALLSLVVNRIKKAIEDDVYIPLYAKSDVEDPNTPHAVFQERQFWTAVKLLQNILRWDGLVEVQTLQEIVLDKLLNRYLLFILLNAQPGPHSFEKCSKIVGYLPGGWFKDLSSGSTLPQLANLSKHLLQFGHLMHKNNYRDKTEEVVLLLVKIKALDSADILVKEYSLDHLKTLIEK
ncbi:intron Large complex component GCFC2 isoform X2 [Ambystoma mexicanum]|uniref:intron Large complex component GCFC2 isoform X2 n=1 Tax=Ambystoma mexicanum TaxID=8296 RepID=UPI0037E8C668